MKKYIANLAQRFNNRATLAKVMGVSLDTMKGWSCGRSKPTGAALRLLQVLGTVAIEAPHILDALAGKEAPLRCAPIVLPPLPPRAAGQAPQAIKRPCGPFAFGGRSKPLTAEEIALLNTPLTDEELAMLNENDRSN